MFTMKDAKENVVKFEDTKHEESQAKAAKFCEELVSREVATMSALGKTTALVHIPNELISLKGYITDYLRTEGGYSNIRYQDRYLVLDWGE